MQETLRARQVDPETSHSDEPLRNYDQYCASTEEAIRKAEGIDLQLLGIGATATSAQRATSSIGSPRAEVLSQETMDDNSKRLAPGGKSSCSSHGIGQFGARKIFLLSGQAKSAAVAKSIEGRSRPRSAPPFNFILT